MDKMIPGIKNDILCAVKEHLNIDLKSPRITEIGDGNINRVFRVEDDETDCPPIVVKYAPESAVILPTIILSRDRGRREGKYLLLASEYAKGMVPKVYFYDEKRYMLFIEDLGNVHTLSEALTDGDFESFDAEKMAGFTADTCFPTSVYSQTRAAQAFDGDFDFHDLCNLTKELVFEQPYYSHENNHFSKENASFIEKNIYSNYPLKQRAEELKNDFLNNHEAVIHGDLHAASVFSIDKKNVVFDGEFTYCGPIAFDLGNVLAHLLMTYFRWKVISFTKKVDEDFEIILKKAFEYLELFQKRFLKLLSDGGKKDIDDEAVVMKIKNDSYSYAGIECIRRVVGLAKAPVFTKNLSEQQRAAAERCIVLAGSELMMKKSAFNSFEKLLDFCETIFTEGIEMN
ncbi:MAG: phosphotransferase [Clostridia bacterium]|nr:phosphotransferase [Clostridia bacterium]